MNVMKIGIVPMQKGESMSKDTIYRQAAIDALSTPHGILYPIRTVEELPSAQPERLTDDDFETIRIHLIAWKERLCNQRRWKEAEEYQRIIDRFMAFASAEPEIIRCKNCRYYRRMIDQDDLCEYRQMQVFDDDFCSRAERRTDETD